MTTATKRAHWHTRAGFLLAAAGSAVGLGNIWKFPYITGENGGGAFVLVYLACVTFVGLPILLAEVYLGRESQRNVVQTFETLHRPGSAWRIVGWLGLLSAFCILGFYSVVGGWVVHFGLKSVTGALSAASDATVEHYLEELFASPALLVLWHTLFMGATVAIVARGVSAGIERANRVMMPGLIVLLVLLLVRAAAMPGFGTALEFLFRFDFEALSARGALVAVGHAFFTLSLGMGAMLTYGSYLTGPHSIARTALGLAVIDTAVSLMAGVVVFTVVFSFGQEPGAGPPLVFVTLPLLFKQMGGGQLVAVAFFLLVFFAALTSAISLLEVVVAYASERFGWTRRRAALSAGAAIYLLGVLCALSFNLLAEVKLLGLTVFDLLDSATSKFTMPLGGLLIALFYGWVLGPRAVAHTVGRPVSALVCQVLLWSTRLVAPLAVAWLLVAGLVDR